MTTKENEDLITFLIRFETYKYQVMSFELCDGPGTYQQFINDHFLNMKEFVSCYLDDLLIFSRLRKEHRKYVQQVLTRLREMKLNIDVLKFKFYVTEIKYLSLIITSEGVKMDSKKIQEIL